MAIPRSAPDKFAPYSMAHPGNYIPKPCLLKIRIRKVAPEKKLPPTARLRKIRPGRNASVRSAFRKIALRKKRFAPGQIRSPAAAAPRSRFLQIRFSGSLPPGSSSCRSAPDKSVRSGPPSPPSLLAKKKLWALESLHVVFLPPSM